MHRLTVVKGDDVQYVQKLALVLVHTLDLDVKHRIRVDLRRGRECGSAGCLASQEVCTNMGYVRTRHQRRGKSYIYIVYGWVRVCARSRSLVCVCMCVCVCACACVYEGFLVVSLRSRERQEIQKRLVCK